MASTPHAAAIGKAVHSAIREAGYSLKDYSQLSGMPSNTLSRRINGHLCFTWSEVAQAAEITGVSISDLAHRVDGILARVAA